jgi:hypothetical protein
MIGKEHRLVTSSSSDDVLTLVKHDAWVYLNLGIARIGYTQEPPLVLDSPLLSLPRYIVSWQRVGAGYGKVLIHNPDNKGKGRTMSASSNLTSRVERHHPPPKICGPPRTMESTDDDMEEEKEELSNELAVSLKQKIAALVEQVVELHLAVYDQKDDFSVLRKATTSKLKRLAKALSDPSLYNAPSP